MAKLWPFENVGSRTYSRTLVRLVQQNLVANQSPFGQSDKVDLAKNKHITSFLDPFPGSVTHFTSFEGIEGEGVLAP